MAEALNFHKKQRGIVRSSQIQRKLWWNGPTWLSCSESTWPLTPRLPSCPEPSEVKEACLHGSTQPSTASTERVILEKFSSFNRMKRVTAWIFRFISNCKLGRCRAPARSRRIERMSYTDEWALASNHRIVYLSKEHNNAIRTQSLLFFTKRKRYCQLSQV